MKSSDVFLWRKNIIAKVQFLFDMNLFSRIGLSTHIALMCCRSFAIFIHKTGQISATSLPIECLMSHCTNFIKQMQLPSVHPSPFLFLIPPLYPFLLNPTPFSPPNSLLCHLYLPFPYPSGLSHVFFIFFVVVDLRLMLAVYKLSLGYLKVVLG